MNTLEPKLLHPYIWVLTEILGLSIPVIAKRTRISRGILDRAYDGQSPGPDQLRKLGVLIVEITNAIGAERSPAPPKNNARLPIPFRFWYIHQRFVDHRKA